MQMARPDDEEIEKAKAETAAALGLVVNSKIQAAQPKTLPQQPGAATYIKYTPTQQGPQYNSGASQRIIKMQVGCSNVSACRAPGRAKATRRPARDFVFLWSIRFSMLYHDALVYEGWELELAVCRQWVPAWHVVTALQDMPVDPMDPPKFRHKKVPRGSGSPPVPIMHSPPRAITVKDQQDWKIPPCISNWKNPKVGGCHIEISDSRAARLPKQHVVELPPCLSCREDVRLQRTAGLSPSCCVAGLDLRLHCAHRFGSSGLRCASAAVSVLPLLIPHHLLQFLRNTSCRTSVRLPARGALHELQQISDQLTEFGGSVPICRGTPSRWTSAWRRMGAGCRRCRSTTSLRS